MQRCGIRQQPHVEATYGRGVPRQCTDCMDLPVRRAFYKYSFRWRLGSEPKGCAELDGPSPSPVQTHRGLFSCILFRVLSRRSVRTRRWGSYRFGMMEVGGLDPRHTPSPSMPVTDCASRLTKRTWTAAETAGDFSPLGPGKSKAPIVSTKGRRDIRPTGHSSGRQEGKPPEMAPGVRRSSGRHLLQRARAGYRRVLAAGEPFRPNPSSIVAAVTRPRAIVSRWRRQGRSCTSGRELITSRTARAGPPSRPRQGRGTQRCTMASPKSEQIRQNLRSGACALRRRRFRRREEGRKVHAKRIYQVTPTGPLRRRRNPDSPPRLPALLRAVGRPRHRTDRKRHGASEWR